MQQPELRAGQSLHEAAEPSDHRVGEKQMSVVDTDHGTRDGLGRRACEQRQADREHVGESGAVEEFESHDPAGAGFVAAGGCQCRAREGQLAEGGDRRAEGDFDDLTRLAVASRPQTPEDDGTGETADRHHGIDGDQPCGRQGVPEEPQVDVLGNPQQVGVEDLLIGNGSDGHHR